MIVYLVFIFLPILYIQPTTCTSLQHEFPTIIKEIKSIINQFHCPKTSIHFGGSCYYLSETKSTPTEAKQTCNQLHSNLMQIRNTVQLFYAAHILIKNNLSELIIDIDIKLRNDSDQWEKFHEEQMKYYKLKEKIFDELNSAGLRISRRSKTTVVEEYEDFDSKNLNDEFEQIENIQRICDRIDWNARNNHSTIYTLTTFLISDKMICSISDVKSDIAYEHICEYVLDFCFANDVCGKHGRCINTVSGFNCSCSFLYDGLLCEKISKQGKQIIAGVIIILVLYVLSIKLIQRTLIFCIKKCIRYCCYRIHPRKKQNSVEVDAQELVRHNRIDNNHDETSHRSTIIGEIMDFILPKKSTKRDLIRLFWVSGLSVLFLTLLLSITTITHFISFNYDAMKETKLESLINDTVRLVAKCENIANYRMENLMFFPLALVLIIVFSWSIKREKHCLSLCDGRPGLIAPIEPFRTTDRFTTATVFCILAFEVLKIFEELLFSTSDPLNRGILIELLERIAFVILIGLRYYPVLASLQLRNITARFIVCPYLIANIAYTIVREGSCMGFLPLSRYNSPLEEAKLRMELGTWFIIYGLIKNISHFILLSYITAELCVRFAYDTIYVPIKKKRSIRSAPVAQPDESAFAKYYVTKLFRQNHSVNQSRVKKFFNSIYHWDDDFRFTTMAVCTYTVALVFLYYLACTLVFLYISRATGHISLIQYYIETTFDVEFQRLFSLNLTILISATIAFSIIVYQLYMGVKNYKNHKLQLYKGIYENIPSPRNFTSNTIASNSIRYFGFLVGHIACGFIILFHLIFILLIGIRILYLRIRYFQLILSVIVPLFIIYLLIMVSISTVGKYSLIQQLEESISLRNRKFYSIFVYFIFIIDCILGIASAIVRLIKAIFLNIINISRLDSSLYGRSAEKFDFGYATYVSYLHMEVAHTNPVMLAFCYSLYEDIVKRRPKHNYDGKCCIAPGEFNDDDDEGVELPSFSTVSKIIPQKAPRLLPIQRSSPPPVPPRQDLVTSKDDEDDDGAPRRSEPSKKKTPSKDKSSKVLFKPLPNMSTYYATISNMINRESVDEIYTLRRQQHARFRWFLAYTILNNYHLLDLRKQVQSRLARLHIHRNNSIDELKNSTISRQSIEETESQYS